MIKSVIAKMPAVGPRPTITTSSIARNSGGMAQRMPSMPLNIALTKKGEMFLAAKSAAGIESTNPRLEPISAISSVSIVLVWILIYNP
jgi:hypothetical protein